MIPIVVRNYTQKDTKELIALQRKAFPPPFPDELLWTKEQINEHTSRFPEGAICIEVDGKLAGSMTTLRIDLKDGQHHTWEEITDSGSIRNHNPKGNTMYVVDICVDPAFRGLGLGRELMRASYEVVVYLGVKRLAGGSRMPGYSSVSEELSPNEYYEKLKSGELHDPVVTFLLKNGRVPVELIPNYIDDEESANHAVLMEWKNPFLI